ncbi:MAG: bifunctional phosphopantothenoylcysteine decarboxylase/phosphopantothenate--cysteine ligase CoaBC [Candidatus Nitrotoga sp.]
MKQSPANHMLQVVHDAPARRIILGITGGIAAYKAAELTRLLIKQGTHVQVAMTEAACHFITPTTMQALSGQPVLTNLWINSQGNSSQENDNQNYRSGDGMMHIHASRITDAIVIAPASADFIAKLAHGLADDLLSTLCLARNCPLIVAPAMNRQMWENAATQRNILQLIADGVILLGPDNGTQACGEEGMGRMQEAARLARDIQAFLQPKLLAGTHVLLTAGPTYEAIDAVRGITNRSSGKMGYAVAQAALELGAKVTLISGPTALPAPQGAKLIQVTSAADMLQAVQQQVADADIFVGVAAVADYRAAQTSTKKIKKGTAKLSLDLLPNPDILSHVASLPKPPFCVGFAAESHDLIKHAHEKRLAKNIPLIAANLAQKAIGTDDSELILIDHAGEHVLPRADKLTLARGLLKHIVALRHSLTHPIKMRA